MSTIGVKVLPTAPIQQPQDQSNQPIRTFKSTNNIKRDADSKMCVVKKTINIKIDSNTSGDLAIDYKHTFEYMPFITLTISCDDKLFGLCYYVSKMTNQGCVVSIQNDQNEPRDLAVYIKAE
jgi:hypothetical protein